MNPEGMNPTTVNTGTNIGVTVRVTSNLVMEVRGIADIMPTWLPISSGVSGYAWS